MSEIDGRIVIRGVLSTSRQSLIARKRLTAYQRLLMNQKFQRSQRLRTNLRSLIVQRAIQKHQKNLTVSTVRARL